MKLENNQSYITNLQFAGGQPVGSGSLNPAAIARGAIQISGSLTATGSLKVTAAGTAGQVLQAGVGGVPEFAGIDGGTY